MAAFSALNIDNAIVKINSPELPALDGSSSEYVKKILNSGIKEQNIKPAPARKEATPWQGFLTKLKKEKN